MTRPCGTGAGIRARIWPEPAQVLRFLGRGRGTPAGRSVRQLVDRMVSLGRSLIEPDLVWKAARILAISPAGVTVEGGVSLRSPRLARALERAEKAVCFVVTIGPALERAVSGLWARGEAAEAYVLDAVGSAAVENLAEALHRALATELAGEGRGVTARFSPGCCDWPVRGQSGLFRVLGPDPAGVRLLESGFMVPRKSVSGVFGVLAQGTAGRGAVPENPCAECPLEGCAMRRENA